MERKVEPNLQSSNFGLYAAKGLSRHKRKVKKGRFPGRGQPGIWNKRRAQ